MTRSCRPQIARLIPYPVQIYEPILVVRDDQGDSRTRRSDRVRRRPSRRRARHPRPAAADPRPRRSRPRSSMACCGSTTAAPRSIRGPSRSAAAGTRTPARGSSPRSTTWSSSSAGSSASGPGRSPSSREPDRFAKIVGELNLVAGLWDQDVSLGGALFGPSSLDPAERRSALRDRSRSRCARPGHRPRREQPRQVRRPLGCSPGHRERRRAENQGQDHHRAGWPVLPRRPAGHRSAGQPGLHRRPGRGPDHRDRSGIGLRGLRRRGDKLDTTSMATQGLGGRARRRARVRQRDPAARRDLGGDREGLVVSTSCSASG